MYDLVFTDGSISRPLTGAALRVGRGPACDVMLSDETVSTMHAALWADGAVVYVQDLASRNGTFINGERVRGIGRAKHLDELRFGNARASLRRREGVIDPAHMLALEDVATGLRVPITRDRLRIGTAPNADLNLPDCPDAVLLVTGDELALGTDEDLQPIAMDVPFALGPRSLCVRTIEVGGRPTRDLSRARYGYQLSAGLSGGPGPWAKLRDPEAGRDHQVEAENRATLLWLLGRRGLDDRAASQPEHLIGWCDETELTTGIWGRSASANPANLRVLACRLRKELRDAGFDPWFIETRSGAMRLRLTEMEIG